MQRLTEDEIHEFLAEETLFQGASDEAIRQLSRLATQQRVPGGQNLFSMGQVCQGLHFVVEGQGNLVKLAEDGKQRILHAAVAGDMVGCIPFFDGKAYPASFVAESDCAILSFPRELLLELLGRHPSLSLSIMGGLVKRMGMLASLLEQLSFKDTEHRLWDFLFERSVASENGDFPRTLESLPTREYIANSIGTVREVVSRRLSRLNKNGTIRIDGRRLVLLKPLDENEPTPTPPVSG